MAEALKGLYRDGIAFIPLSDKDDVISSIVEGLSLGGIHSEKTLTDYLRDKDILLILDNFEQHLASSQAVGRLIHECHKLQVVVTSREILNIRPEQVFQVQGLIYPKGESLELWKSCDAMRLLDRLVRQINPYYPEDINTIRSVREIIAKIDGHPLAIEFAAGYIAQHNFSELGQLLENGLDFRQEGFIDIPARQRSLEAIFEQSWLALEDRERSCLSGLAVFQEGFTLEAGKEVVKITQTDIDLYLGKSLLMLDDRERYRIHGVTRQFILEREKIDDSVWERYAHYYAKFA